MSSFRINAVNEMATIPKLVLEQNEEL